MLVQDGRIARVGRDLETGNAFEVMDATDQLVMPGMVNAHTRAHNHLARGSINGLPLEVWLLHLGARVANRTPRDIYVGAGSTCACEMAQILPWPTDETLDAVL